MNRPNHGIAVVLTALLLALLSACGGGSDEPSDGAAKEGGSDEDPTADPDAVDPCSLLAPDEVRVFVEANREAVLNDTTVEITEVGAGTSDSPGLCGWELALFDRASHEACIASVGDAEACEPHGRRTERFLLGVAQLGEDPEACLVASDGLCVYLSASYADAPAAEMPPELESAVRARLTS